MKTNLRELTKWMVAMLLCTVSFTAFAADEADFTGTTININGGTNTEGMYFLGLDGTEWAFDGMFANKPSYATMAYMCDGMDRTPNDSMVVYIKWDRSGTIGSDADSTWMIASDNGMNQYFFNDEKTDSVPMNGWFTAGDKDEISFDMTGCVEDNIPTDPLAGASVTLAGSDDLNGEYAYIGKVDGYPSFVDTLAVGVVTIEYRNYEWQIILGADSVLYTNDLYNRYKMMPANNWVAEFETTDYISLSSEQDVIVNYFQDYSIYIDGEKYAGEYTFVSMLGQSPAYACVDGNYKHVIYKNDSAWVLVSGVALSEDFTSFDIQSYSLKESIAFVPQNGWTNYDGDVTSPEVSGSASDFITKGEVVIVSGTDFDAELTYNGDGNYSHSFAGMFNGTEVSITNIDDVWTITYNDSAYYTCDAYISGGLVPDFAWIGADGVYSPLTLSGDMTGSSFEGESANVSGLDDYTVYFEYCGIVNDRLAFTDGTRIMKCVENVWGIYADADAVDAIVVSTLSSPFYIPQNGWNDDVVIGGNNVSKFMFDADVLTVSNTGTDVDGEYAFFALDDSYNHNPIYTKVVGEDTYMVAYLNWEWELLVNDSVLYTCSNSVYVNNNNVIPQNTWVSLTDSTSFVYLDGGYTGDVYADEEINYYGNYFSYNGMVNNHISFSTEDSLFVQHNGTAWEILSKETVIYTNTAESEFVPSNMWVAVDGGDDILIDGNRTSFFYDDVVLSGLSLDIANGTYVIEDNDSYYPTFIKQITTGEYTGGQVSFTLNYNGVEVKLTAPGVDSVLCANSNVPRNSLNIKVAPQNFWTVDGVIDATISAAGQYSTLYINGVVITGDEAYAGTYNYTYGTYLAEVNYNEVELLIVENGDSSFWQLSQSGGFGIGSTDNVVLTDDDVIAVNYNINGNLLPQNKWIVGGVADTLFTVYGDSTFFVEDAPASLVDAKSTEFSIYPNPAQYEVNIDVAAAGSLEVYSLSGAVVMASFLQEGHNTVSISTLDKGMYILITTIDGERGVSRLIKE